MDELEDKIILGLDEYITIIDKSGNEKRFLARIDSGAESSSIDESIYEELFLGPVLGTKLIKSASGKKRRKVLRIKIKLKDKEFREKFTIADRSELTYKVLIGHDILTKGFMIDPSIERIRERV
ncbi:MAG: RimK/LysX family protein [Candidatus Nanoarchaeia archaeon]|nr:RimK/LysX family protein [Candidatus Nanoarchaeia archaeon]